MSRNLFDFGNENREEFPDNAKNFEKNSDFRVEKDYSSSNLSDKSEQDDIFLDNKNINAQSNSLNKEEVVDFYNKYKDVSQNDLINEVLNASREKLQDGSISKEQLAQTFEMIFPYVSDEQKKFLINLFKEIDG